MLTEHLSSINIRCDGYIVIFPLYHYLIQVNMKQDMKYS